MNIQYDRVGLSDSMIVRVKQTSYFNDFIFIFMFIASIYPFSLTLKGGGVTANYVFVFIPVILSILGIRNLYNNQTIFLSLIILFLIYAAGFVGDITGVTYSPVRRLLSFIVFIIPYSLCFIRFKPKDLILFKKSIVLISTYFSLISIMRMVDYYNLSFSSLKGLIGSQRFGFILILGFFIALSEEKGLFIKKVLLEKIMLSSIIFMGVFLTFSRSSVVSLLIGLVCYVILNIKNSKVERKNIFFLIFFVFISLLVLNNYLSQIIMFYDHYFFQPLFSGELTSSLLSAVPGSSEGYRTHVFRQIFDYLSIHPIFGSKFMGIWMLYDEYHQVGGSTHNQYTDVLLRTGIVGFSLFMYFIYRIIRSIKVDYGLLSGFIGILIYGLFHETFKLSQGSFIFCMLLSFSFIKGRFKFWSMS